MSQRTKFLIKNTIVLLQLPRAEPIRVHICVNIIVLYEMWVIYYTVGYSISNTIHNSKDSKDTANVGHALKSNILVMQ